MATSFVVAIVDNSFDAKNYLGIAENMLWQRHLLFSRPMTVLLQNLPGYNSKLAVATSFAVAAVEEVDIDVVDAK